MMAEARTAAAITSVMETPPELNLEWLYLGEK